jgi:AraC family transcriptional regulator, transcriptional activator of pobA
MPDQKRILSEFRKAIKFYAKPEVVDLDINFNESFNFQALRLEDVFRINKSVPPNRWSFHRIGIITEGTGEFQTSLYKIPAKRHVLVIVPARVITCSHNWSDDVKGLIVLFNLQFLLQQSFPYKLLQNKKILNSLIKPYVYLSEEEGAYFTGLFEAFLEEQEKQADHWQEFVSLKLVELIIACERVFEANHCLSDQSTSSNIAYAFSYLLEQHFQEQHSVAFYASKLNIHPYYLNAQLKKYTGEGAKETITNRLLIEIKYLLYATDMSVKEIASQLGFSDPNYLSSFFKRIEKVSPQEYRATNSKT